MQRLSNFPASLRRKLRPRLEAIDDLGYKSIVDCEEPLPVGVAHLLMVGQLMNMNPFFGDDAEMNAAIEEAQRRLPEFRRALEDDARRVVPQIEGALVKARFESIITHKVEHLWIEDVSFEEDMIAGTLSSNPEAIPEHREGERVSVSPEILSDWVYRRRGRTYGGFTIRIMQKRGLQW